MLVRVSKSDIYYPEIIPFTKNTLYLWNHQNKYPYIFKKLGKSLFIDTDALQELIMNNGETTLDIN